MVAQAKTRLIVAIAVVGAACGGPSQPRFPRAPVERSLPSIDGGEIDFASFRGRIVVVHFFATWSLASQADVTELRRARGAWRDLEIIGVGLDPDGSALLVPWRDAAGVAWWIAGATPDLVAGETPFGKIDVVPTTFVLDRAGRIVWKRVGPLSPRELDRVAHSLEAKPARP